VTKEPLEYSVSELRRDVVDLTDSEIDWLADNYTSYRQKNWRMTLLEGVKRGWDNYTIFCNKIKDKDIDIKSSQSEGGHIRMIPNKIRKAAMRLLYVRYRGKGCTQRQANKMVRENHFPDVKRDTIAKNTRYCQLDKKV
jgi:hypothetical protein